MMEEKAELEKVLGALNENIEELEELLGSGEEVEALLHDYRAYQEMMASGGEVGETLEEIEAQKEHLRQMIESSENKEYIVRVAKERLHLYFPDEEIFYNDQNN